MAPSESFALGAMNAIVEISGPDPMVLGNLTSKTSEVHLQLLEGDTGGEIVAQLSHIIDGKPYTLKFPFRECKVSLVMSGKVHQHTKDLKKFKAFRDLVSSKKHTNVDGKKSKSIKTNLVRFFLITVTKIPIHYRKKALLDLFALLDQQMDNPVAYMFKAAIESEESITIACTTIIAQAGDILEKYAQSLQPQQARPGDKRKVAASQSPPPNVKRRRSAPSTMASSANDGDSDSYENDVIQSVVSSNFVDYADKLQKRALNELRSFNPKAKRLAEITELNEENEEQVVELAFQAELQLRDIQMHVRNLRSARAEAYKERPQYGFK